MILCRDKPHSDSLNNKYDYFTSDLTRLDVVDEKALNRIKKYSEAIRFLLD